MTMAAAENNVELKRKADQTQDEDGENEEWVGPMPSEAATTKKRKGGCDLLNTETDIAQEPEMSGIMIYVHAARKYQTQNY